MPYRSYKRRDLSVIDIDGRRCLVIAADSCGAVGGKPGDVLKAPASVAGAFTARVALMEVMASGAEVVCVTACVASELDPTGREIMEGVAGELRKAGAPEDCIGRAGLANGFLNGSTEENFSTVMTGLGVTVVGIADKRALKFRCAADKDLLLLFGEPLVGQEVLNNRGRAVAYETLRALARDKNVREISPVGSKGIAFECEALAAVNGGRFVPYECGVDTKKSGGPATCAVALVSPDFVKNLDAAGFVTLGEFSGYDALPASPPLTNEST